MDPRLTALNRFGLGARVGEAERLRDPRGWLLEQLDRGPPRLETRDLPDAGAATDAFRAARAAQRAGDEDALRAARRRMTEALVQESRAALRTRIDTERPFVERWVAFWSNHLCISVQGKIQVIPFAGRYEREVIRPHALGRYEEMVLASARHPGMLLYLDNAQSVGPDSRGAATLRRRGGGPERGLNENYARELLELHTVGVDGGYDQDDVEALARIFTGWTLDRAGPEGRPVRGRRRRAAMSPSGEGNDGFVFRPMIHEPGSKTVLGVRYPSGGVEEGEDAIRDLCRHPRTADHLALKVARHFVADEPPPALLDALAHDFQRTEGDLASMARTLIRSEGAWEGGRKFRSPQDWLVAAFRTVEAREIPVQAVGVLRQLRQPLWGPSSPKGYPDHLGAWADPDALMNRAELARSLAGRLARAPLSPSALLETVDRDEAEPLRRLLAGNDLSREEALALVLAGPAFQWR